MPGWAATILAALLGLMVAILSGTFVYVIAQERRITQCEERLRSLGAQLRDIPKRHNDLAGK